ncbi:MAG: ABC-2 family transporter protein [Defluviitaleaceae bacterium]|nr:ABC-2 family transporter protein [Defluviitaleaceae bacterium]
MKHYIKLYAVLIAKDFRRFATYRTNIFAGITSALFMLAARYALWVTLFATGNAGDVTLAETMTFFVVGDVVMILTGGAGFTGTSLSEVIGADNMSGDIALKLSRPCSYHFQLVAGKHAGAIIQTLSHSLPIFIVAVIFIGILPPSGAEAFVWFVVAAILGGVILTLIDLILAYSVFWLTDFWYIAWYKRALFMLFGGTFLPLWFYPDSLRAAADVLPFRFAMFVPMEVYLGRLYGREIFVALGSAIFWIVVLFAVERLIWRRVQFKLVVQGG